MTYPENYRYTKEHEWVHLEGEIATIGITFHAQSELGDIVFVELPAVGAKLEKSASLGSIESVKAVSDVYAPVGGEVTETNEALTSAPEKVNEDPQGAGWLIKVKVSNKSDLDGLMTAAAYEAYVGAES
ncbi:MAG TPA: glycine cleavage system protein GcvH [Bryobacteraceae bacterium]|jgi:glycine cleavage system H protein|nr:glycine cleavage system protein GcvH [Bryobacteraceae bacterium]